MDRRANPDHLTLHLDWRADPPRRRLDLRVLPSEPHSLERTNAEAEGRVRLAIEPYLTSGWEPDGELLAATSLSKRRRQVLLPTPGVAGPMWEEYVGADVHLRRVVPLVGSAAR
jgi:hypothetical protein